MNFIASHVGAGGKHGFLGRVELDLHRTKTTLSLATSADGAQALLGSSSGSVTSGLVQRTVLAYHALNDLGIAVDGSTGSSATGLALNMASSGRHARHGHRSGHGHGGGHAIAEVVGHVLRRHRVRTLVERHVRVDAKCSIAVVARRVVEGSLLSGLEPGDSPSLLRAHHVLAARGARCHVEHVRIGRHGSIVTLSERRRNGAGAIADHARAIVCKGTTKPGERVSAMGAMGAITRIVSSTAHVEHGGSSSRQTWGRGRGSQRRLHSGRGRRRHAGARHVLVAASIARHAGGLRVAASSPTTSIATGRSARGRSLGLSWGSDQIGSGRLGTSAERHTRRGLRNRRRLVVLCARETRSGASEGRVVE